MIEIYKVNEGMEILNRVKHLNFQLIIYDGKFDQFTLYLYLNILLTAIITLFWTFVHFFIILHHSQTDGWHAVFSGNLTFLLNNVFSNMSFWLKPFQQFLGARDNERLEKILDPFWLEGSWWCRVLLTNHQFCLFWLESNL